MALFHDSAIAGASGQAAGGAYKIERSLRFNSSDSAYCSRVPSSAGNRKTWTWAAWIKRAAGFTEYFGFVSLFSGGTSASTNGRLAIGFSSGALAVDNFGIGAYATSAVFRDYSAWYHVVIAFDTTQATASNRIKIYVNGEQQVIGTTTFTPAQNTDYAINLNQQHNLGALSDTANGYWAGYLADVHFIDGQALDPTSFAETNATTGQWVPKAYSGTYGTNGFRLAFADNSNNTATTLGKDSSPNGNNWTPNNLSVTAGAGNDSLVDTPTSYGTDTGTGGEVRGNYCTANPLNVITANGVSISNGNLDISLANATTWGTIAIPQTGKWYFEVRINRLYPISGGGYGGYFGIAKVNTSIFSGVLSQTGVDTNGGIYKNNAKVEALYAGTVGDVYGIAFNADSLSLQIYRNGAAHGSAITLDASQYVPYFQGNGFNLSDANQQSLNFGQRQWAYQAPAGFKALCDTNLPAPVVAKPNTAFDVKLYTGNGSTQAISGLGFSPDLVWVKERNSLSTYAIWDQVRGASKLLSSNVTAAEATTNALSSFDSSGFTVLYPNTDDYYVNRNSQSYVAWSWDAGSSTVTNTQGSITSQVRANASAGFSVVTFTGGGAGSTIGHGLGVAPQLIIVKDRGVSSDWCVYHVSTGAGNFTKLNTIDASTANTTMWGNTTPTSTNFIWGFGSGNNYVAYCFAPAAGYSSFGSYTGNGNTSGDGPFVFCGFRPRYVLIRNVSRTENWIVHDTARDPYNVTTAELIPNSSGAEGNTTPFDILSNGFKIRNTTTNNGINASNETHIYCAFAESSFQYARAR